MKPLTALLVLAASAFGQCSTPAGGTIPQIVVTYFPPGSQTSVQACLQLQGITIPPDAGSI